MFNPVIVVTFQAIAVAAIYCIWRAYRQAIDRKKPQLRDRIAFMLWAAANDLE